MQHRSLTKVGLDTIVINGDTVLEARHVKRNLWTESYERHTMILISPEELTSRDFRGLLESKSFTARLCRFGIDEVHLIHAWGASKFRPAFLELGSIRARLPAVKGKFMPIIATSATIRPGPPTTTICRTLGLEPGNYHLLRRSNLRNDIQIIIRELKSSLGGLFFPDLDWVLESGENTVIFCKTIGLGFRVAAYLWRTAMARKLPNLGSRIRLYNSLNSKSFNEETLGFLNANESASVTIATDVLSVGWDSPSTRDAIVLGLPDDLDEFVQKIGRAGRNRIKVPYPRAFLYHPKTSLAPAQSGGKTPRSSTSATTVEAMDISVRDFLLAECKSENLNVQYENPLNDPWCTCPRCGSDLVRSSDKEPCRCSGCVPETEVPSTQQKKKAPAKTRAQAGQGISKKMRELATEQLNEVRQVIFDDADPIANSMLAPQEYLTTDIINMIINNLYRIHGSPSANEGVETVSQLMANHNPLLQPYYTAIYEACCSIVPQLEGLRTKEKAERVAKRLAAKGDADEEDIDAVEPSIVVDEEGDEEVVFHDARVSSGIKWKINFKTNVILQA